MKILVTGAAGFVGSNLCLRLLQEGHHVIGIDNLITGSKKNVKDLSKHPHFKFIKHDITKPLLINHQLFTLRKTKGSTIDQIYHLACPTGVDNLVPLAQEMLLTCSLGTINVLELAKKKKARVLLTSSSEAYGDPQEFPQNEQYRGNVDPVGIRSPYEEGKRFSESLVAMYVRKFKLNSTIVRIFNTYGPRMSKTDGRVVPVFLRQSKEGVPLTVHGKGQQERTFCYVDDMVNGLIVVMRKGKRGEVYNIGSDTKIKVADLAGLIIKLTKTKSIIKSVERPAHDHQSRQPDLTKIKKFGWMPKVPLEEGLIKTLTTL